MRTIQLPLRALPEIARAGRYPMAARQSRRIYVNPTVALHQHDYGGDVYIGKERFRLRPGDITLTPAHVDSFYNIPAPGYHLCIHFFPGAGDGAIISLPLVMRLGPESAFASRQMWIVCEMHRRAFKAGKRGEVAGTAAAAGLQSLLLWLSLFERRPAESRRSVRSDIALGRLNTLLENRFTEPLTISQIAREVGLSQNYLARLFHERYGMTIPRYLLLRRIDLARHLLSTSDEMIKQIAIRVGLPDSQYFNKQFRRLTGASPTQFREALPKLLGP